MSNYWQGKGAGKRIGIRFDKPLVGDVTGNETAFTVTGMVRDPLKYGPLVERNFTVESVERYPIEQYWRDEFDGDMDGLEAGEYGLGLEREGGDYTDDLTGGQSYISTSDFSSSYAKHMAFDDNTSTLWAANGAIGQAVGVNFGTAKTIKKLRMMTNGRLKDFDLEGSNDGSVWATVFSGTQLSNSNWQEYTFNNLTGYHYYRVKCTSTLYTGSNVMIAEVEMMERPVSFGESGNYTLSLDASTLSPAPRFRCETSTPDDTAIIIEYACTAGDEPDSEGWAEIEDGDLLDITADILWLRYTLTTDDPAVTPTLLSAWLEEADAPPGTILLTMAPDSRFNDVEGDLTVSYEQATGTLTGTRPVEDFTESFTPTGLEPTPIDRHDITAGIELEVDFIEVDYRYFKDDSADHIITAGITVEVDLIPVSVIPP